MVFNLLKTFRLLNKRKERKKSKLNPIIKKTDIIDMYFKFDIVSEPLTLRVTANNMIEKMNHKTDDIKLTNLIILIPFPEVIKKYSQISTRKLNHIAEKKKQS